MNNLARVLLGRRVGLSKGDRFQEERSRLSAATVLDGCPLREGGSAYGEAGSMLRMAAIRQRASVFWTSRLVHIWRGAAPSRGVRV